MRKPFLFLLFILFSISGFAQKSWKTQIVPGISTSKFDDHFKREKVPSNDLFVMFNETWNRKDDHKYSLAKEFGLSLNYHNLSRKNEALGGGDIYSGDFFYTSFHASVLGQMNAGEDIQMQLGIKLEELIVGYENLSYSYWSSVYYPPTSGGKSKKGFNRDYFDQPYYGVNLKILQNTEGTFHAVGFDLSYLWTNASLSNFNTKHFV